LINRNDIARVETLIRPHIRRTPVAEIGASERGLSPGPIVLKLEFMQHTGSFKARGAFANLLTQPIPKTGVVAASGGNHGAGVAYAARDRGVPATIFVPSIASPAKIERIRSYGAKIIVGGERYADALAASGIWRADTGALAIHAYDTLPTILGQASLALELEAQAPGLDTILIAVGGGGLIAGLASWYSGRARLIGVEPEAIPTLHAALAAGAPVDVAVGGIAADSLGARRIGDAVFPITSAHVDEVILVPDEAIRAAQIALWETLRIAVEPGGAAAFAALQCGRFKPRKGERVGIILCGANTGAVDFSR
jgi:threonine dehydratase